MNFMKDKQVGVMSLLAKPHDDVQVKSRLLDPAGTLIRSLDLLAPIVNYDKINDRLIVPVPGRMLVRDFPKGSATKPTDEDEDAAAPAGGGGGMKGTTAFQWTKTLIYDRASDQAIMTGDTHVVHQAASAAGYEIFADQIVTDMESTKPATRPATPPATQTATSSSTSPPTKPSDSDAMKVKRMTATGAVRMISVRMTITAAQAVYDPATQIMTANGSARQPVELFDSQGVSTGTFDDVQYNMQTGLVEHLGHAHVGLRR